MSKTKGYLNFNIFSNTTKKQNETLVFAVTELNDTLSALKEAKKSIEDICRNTSDELALKQTEIERLNQQIEDMRKSKQTEIDHLVQSKQAEIEALNKIITDIQSVLGQGDDAEMLNQISVIIAEKDAVSKDKEKSQGNDVRRQNVEKKKNWLIIWSVMITFSSFNSALYLSPFSGRSAQFNGSIVMSSSGLSIIFSCIRSYISYKTAVNHLRNDRGIDDRDITHLTEKNWTAYLLLMKTISMGLASINDSIFDLFQGWAAIRGEPYSDKTLIMLWCSTSIGVGEEAFELLVEICFMSAQLQCKNNDYCGPMVYNTLFLVWSIVESCVGIYLLNTYNTNALIILGVMFEGILLIAIICSLIIFWWWRWKKTSICSRKHDGFKIMDQ